ncbi:MAG: hypothetical protein ACJ8D0_22045, partial [Xanthobacteraceae bacterium]
PVVVADIYGGGFGVVARFGVHERTSGVTEWGDLTTDGRECRSVRPASAGSGATWVSHPRVHCKIGAVTHGEKAVRPRKRAHFTDAQERAAVNAAAG